LRLLSMAEIISKTSGMIVSFARMRHLFI